MATILLRRGTAAAWTTANPTLAAGEAGVETDTLKFKIGNGSTAWNSLAYQGGGITALTGDVTATGPGSVAATIANDAVTYAKMQNVSATDKLLGRATSGAGDVEEIACTAAGRALLDDADATAQRTTLGLGTLATQSGTFSGTHSGTSSGTNTGDQTITLTGDVTGSGTGSFAATVANDAVTDAKLRNSAALSVVGRSANSTGDPADIAAASDGQVLRRSGTTLGFGAVDLAGANAVTGTLPIASGGTGQTSAANAINALVPTQTGNAGKFLTTDGSAVSWDTPGGSVVSDQVVTTGVHVISAANGVWADVTELTLTLPAAGTYLVTVTVFAFVANSSGSFPRMSARLVLNGSTVTGSEFYAVEGIAATSAWMGGNSRTFVVTAGGAHVIKVQGMRNISGGGAFTSSQFNNDAGGVNSLAYVQAPTVAGSVVGGQAANLLVNGDFRRLPRQARATLTTYISTGAHGPTNWYLQDNGSTDIQFRNWTQGDGSPPASFAELGPSYLQIKNNSGSAKSFALGQFIEANGPGGLAAASLRATAIAAGFRAIASAGTPTLKIAIREWTGTADAPTKPVASWSLGVPTFQTTNYASVATGSAALNTSTATPVTATGTPSSSCVGLWVIAYVESLANGASIYLGQAQLVRGSQVPTWAPHPADNELCQRYCESSYTPGVGPGTASTAVGMAVFPTPSSVANNALVGGVRFAVTKRDTPWSYGTYNYAGTANTMSDYANNNMGATSITNIGPTGFSVQNGAGGTINPASGGIGFHWFASAEINPT